MATPFQTRRRVEFADTDMAGIVHFANFFRFMEAAEVDFLHALGLSVRLEWEGQRLGFPRVSASCDYLRPVTFEDVLDVTVTLEKVGMKSVSYTFDFASRGQVVARGRVVTVCCRIGPDHKIEAVAIPATLRDRLKGTRQLAEEPG